MRSKDIKVENLADSCDDLVETPFVRGPLDLHRDAAPRAHRPPPQRVSIWMANAHVDVGSPANPRGNVVHVEVLLLVHARLEGEGPEDPGGVVGLCRLHPP